MKKFIEVLLFGTLFVSLYGTPLFTPQIDGVKEAAWGSTPDASSASYASISSVLADGFHFENAAQDIYVTDDPNYLYIGYFYNGDAVDGYPSSRLNFGIITNASGNTGGNSDPWNGGVTYGSGNHPDFLLRQWTESQSDERMEFGPALGYSTSETKGVAEFLNWNGSAWVGAGSVIHYERLTLSSSANNWGEIAIPLDTLGVETGDSIRIFYYYRPSDSCNGFSDSTPYDPNASADGSTAASINSNFTYTIRSDNIKPTISENSPSHTSTGQNRAVNISFRVTDNIAFSSTNINVTISGNDAILAGVFQNGYSGSIVTNSTSDYSVSIDPDEDFDFSQKVTVGIDIRDETGNLQEQDLYFYIEDDNEQPTYSSVSPADGSSGVSRDALISFDMADNDQVVLGSLIVWVNGSLAYTNGAFQSGFDGVSSAVVPTFGGYQVTVDPDPDFDFEEVVTLQAEVADRRPNTASLNISFTNEADSVVPLSFNWNPSDGSVQIQRNASLQVSLKDNIDLDINSLNLKVNGSFYIQNGTFESGISGEILWDATNQISINITNHPLFDYASVITQTVEIADQHANCLYDTNIFSVKQDDVAPLISSFSLDSNSVLVSRASALSFEISDDDAVNLDKLDIKVSGNDAVKNGIALGTYSYTINTNGNSYTVELTNSELYAYEETVSVRVSVEDVSQNYASATTSFTIREDFVDPTIALISPINGSTTNHKDLLFCLDITDDNAVDIYSLVVFQGSHLVLSNAQFSADYLGLSGGIVKVDNGHYQITVDPVEDYDYNEEIQLNVRVKDQKGNGVTNDFAFQIAQDYMPPVLVDSYPEDYQTHVNYRTNLIFEFSDDGVLDLDTLTVSVAEEGESPVLAYSNSQFDPLYHGIESSLVQIGTNESYRLVLDRINEFPLSNNITVTLSVSDTNGNALDQTLHFSTAVGDISKPQVSYMTPQETNVEPDILLNFVCGDNGEVDITTLNVQVIVGNETNTAIQNGQFQAGYLGPFSSKKTNALGGYDVVLDRESNFPYDTWVKVLVSLKDESGNENNSQDWIFKVRPPDTEAPVIRAVNPLSNTSDIGIDTTISFEITDNYFVPSNWIEVMVEEDCAYTNGEFQLGFDGAASSIRANADGGWLVTVKPNVPLPFNQWIDIRVSARDSSTNQSVFAYRFKTYDSKIAVPIQTALNLSKDSDQKIRIKLNRFGNLKATIFNLRGEKIGEIPEKFYNLGETMEWVPKLAGGLVPGSGVYFLKIEGQDVDYTMKIVIIK